MVDSEVNSVTLEYMVNRAQYEKYLQKNNISENELFYKEKRFYRKRIMQVAKDLLKNQTIPDMGVIHSFDMFCKSCISYFKCKDKNDILQEEYNDLDLPLEQNAEKINNFFSSDDDADDESNIKNYKILKPIPEEEELHSPLFIEKEEEDESENIKKIDLKIINDSYNKKPTLDTFIKKKERKKEEVKCPLQKEVNLNDPKLKKKDIKKKIKT